MKGPWFISFHSSSPSWLTVALPTAFAFASPVRERRGLMASTYLAGALLAWCIVLPVAIVVPLAGGGAALLFACIGLVLARSSWREERLMARIDRGLRSPQRREAALRELRERIAQFRS